MQSTPLVYNAKKIHRPIRIDGKATEEEWKNTSWTSPFVDIEGDNKAIPKLKTKAKMLWDNEYLYIYAELEEPHVWGDIKEHDAIIYHNNDFEIFIKPFDKQPFYYEIEINALNTVMDLMMPKAYRLGGDALMHWDLKGLKSAIHIEGSLNNNKDIDKYWSVEVAIPFHSLSTFAKAPTPAIGSYWKINFSRVQWQHEKRGNGYERKTTNNKLLPEDNWVWSPIGVINMHFPERWGYVRFTDDDKSESELPENFYIERLAWNIYYLQQEFKRKNGTYALTATTLPGFQNILKSDLSLFDVDFLLNDAKTFYKIKLKDKKRPTTVTIDSYGNYHINDD
ncbi:carbohydrate-binding family 9-like protein [Sphingobacterium sp. LRF_L2]|uniref:carbohydrate-binding family 9-like protein n=1 Tax=Sphingobacterium sp. LRF_L2 TaxID=3369421 RepID=UPI003F6070B6